MGAQASRNARYEKYCEECGFVIIVLTATVGNELMGVMFPGESCDGSHARNGSVHARGEVFQFVCQADQLEVF